MTYDVEVIELPDVPGYRARIVLDECPQEPEDDGQSPILRIDDRDGRAIGHVMQGSYTDKRRDAAIEYAWNYFQDHNVSGWRPDGPTIRRYDPAEAFKRYLRIFWGVTTVKTWESYSTRGPMYLTYDPEGWRRDIGFPTDADLPAGFGDSVNLSEWIAYCEGDVYGIIIEKETPVSVTDIDGLTELEPEWDEIESVWGFYGDVGGYVTREAGEMIRQAAGGEVAA